MPYMPYTTNPRLPHVRGEAVKLVRQGWSMRSVARHLGYEPSTILRWVRKGIDSRRNIILTESSRPHSQPHALSNETIAAIIQERLRMGRCCEVVHYELQKKGLQVSLSSVKRVLKRRGLLKARSPWCRKHQYVERPEVASPGDLVELDTIHIVPLQGTRFYIYTLLDVFSRWAFAWVSARINTHRSLRFLRHAQEDASFAFHMLQSDHGSEFSMYFTEHAGFSHRHSRVRQPNDNAHLERFNRTLQEEALRGVPENLPAYRRAVHLYLPYYNHERPHLSLDFLAPAQVLRRS